MAKPAIPGGLVQLKIEKRLAEIAKLGPPPSELLVGGGEPEGADTVSPGGWIDLLPRIDTTRDAVGGSWKRQGEAIVVAAGDFARLMLPLRLAQADYDIEIEFARSEGTEGVGLILPVAGSQVAFLMSAANGTTGGLELFDGKRVTDNKNLTRRPGNLPNGYRHIVLVGVRHQKKMAQIDAVHNGKPYTRGIGDRGKFLLPAEWALPDADRPALAMHQSAVTLRRVRLRLASGTGTFVTGAKSGSTGRRPAGAATEPNAPKFADPKPFSPPLNPAPSADPSPPKGNGAPLEPRLPAPRPPGPDGPPLDL
jgi:hypothetical protein